MQRMVVLCVVENEIAAEHYKVCSRRADGGNDFAGYEVVAGVRLK